MGKPGITQKDTLAAITTPVGEGGIGIVTVVGPRALQVVSELFQGKRIADLPKAQSRKLYYGHIVEQGSVIDEVIVAVFREGESFLGPEVVEINCHGGIVCVNEVMRALDKRGVKPGSWQDLVAGTVAKGGLDRLQEEALAELVQAKTELAARLFLAQYEGSLSREVRKLKAQLEETAKSGSREALESAHSRLRGLADSARVGLAFSKPRSVVVCGRTNVGKSSLVNALLKARRVIVDSAPGTTRDAVEVVASADGLPVKLVDTAGLRETQDEIEIMGLRKAYESMAEADLLLGVFDHSAGVVREEEHFARELASREALVAANKADVPSKLDLGLLQKLTGQKPCSVSALLSWGIAELGAYIRKRLLGSCEPAVDRPVVFTRRQQKLISKTQADLSQAMKQLGSRLPREMRTHVRKALASLDEILG